LLFFDLQNELKSYEQLVESEKAVKDNNLILEECIEITFDEHVWNKIKDNVERETPLSLFKK